VLLTWEEVDDTRTQPFKCALCKAKKGPYSPCFYLVKEKQWIPHCSRDCRNLQKAKWAKKKDNGQKRLLI
jgi:hypothetical protein